MLIERGAPFTRCVRRIALLAIPATLGAETPSEAFAADAVEVVIDTVDLAGERLDGGHMSSWAMFADNTWRPTPLTVSKAEGSAFSMSGHWGLLSGGTAVTIRAGTTTTVDARSGQVTVADSEATRIHFAFEPIPVRAETVDPQGAALAGHIASARIWNDWTQRPAPLTFTMANGGSTYVVGHWGFLTRSSETLTFTKGTTFSVDALTGAHTATAGSAETTIRFVFEPMEVRAQVVDLAGNAIPDGVVYGAQVYNDWTRRPAPLSFEMANGGTVSFYGSWGYLAAKAEGTTLLRGTTVSVDALSRTITREETGVTGFRFVFEPIDVVLDTVGFTGCHLDGQLASDTLWNTWSGQPAPQTIRVANGGVLAHMSQGPDAFASLYGRWKAYVHEASRVSFRRGVDLRIDAVTGARTDVASDTPRVSFVFPAVFADAGDDRTVDGTGESTTVQLDGSRSCARPNATFRWTGDFDGGAAEGPQPSVVFHGLGTRTATLVVSDGAEVSEPDTVLITIRDAIAPRLAAPADLTVECTGRGGQAVELGGAVASDESGPVTVANDAPTLFVLGATAVTWTATDPSGNESSATQIVTVRDTTPPAITAAPGVTVECTAAGGQAVTLDRAVATDVCSDVTITNDAPALFRLGTTVVTWTATDAHGNSATAAQHVNVVDTTPPSLDIAGLASELWPPNHQLVRFQPEIVVSDAADSAPRVTLAITSNEADDGLGDGDTAGDIDTSRGARDFDLRAERSGTGTGRVYTLVWTATDASGNSTTRTLDVHVPLSKR